MKTINLEPNWKNVYRFIMAQDEETRSRMISTMGEVEWEKLKICAGVEND